MSKQDLNKIKPLTTLASERLYAQKPNTFSESQDLDCKEVPVTFFKQNLSNEIVYIFWKKKIAVQTDTETLIRYFSDFCYPSSDDVTIWPKSEKWLLQYHHYEKITFSA
jgi:hypothetical protein